MLHSHRQFAFEIQVFFSCKNDFSVDKRKEKKKKKKANYFKRESKFERESRENEGIYAYDINFIKGNKHMIFRKIFTPSHELL